MLDIDNSVAAEQAKASVDELWKAAAAKHAGEGKRSLERDRRIIIYELVGKEEASGESVEKDEELSSIYLWRRLSRP